MENQINMGDQSNQKRSQNPINQPIVAQEKPKVNYWMILTLVFGFLFLVIAGINLVNFKTSEKKTSPVTPSPQPSITPVPTKSVGEASRFTGTVKTGAQLGEVKSYCPNGLYLVADKGTYLADQTTMLQLRLPNEPDGTKMLSGQKYIGKKVEVVGRYPAQEGFCEALICECEDYILVEHINIATAQSVEDKQTKIEGQIVCLPHRDKTGPQTEECAFGLQGKDNKYYGLRGLNQQDLISGKMSSGRKVIIIGMLTFDQDSKYDLVGTIDIASVEYIN